MAQNSPSQKGQKFSTKVVYFINSYTNAKLLTNQLHKTPTFQNNFNFQGIFLDTLISHLVLP